MSPSCEDSYEITKAVENLKIKMLSGKQHSSRALKLRTQKDQSRTVNNDSMLKGNRKSTSRSSKKESSRNGARALITSSSYRQNNTLETHHSSSDLQQLPKKRLDRKPD